MALGQVSQFVGQHGGVFGLGLRVGEEAAVDADDPAGGGEGIQLGAVEQDELEAPVLQLAAFGQAIHAALDVILEERVGNLFDLSAQHAQPRPSELVLLFG